MDDKHKIIQALDRAKKTMPSSEILNKMENFAVAYANRVNSFSKETLMGMAASFLILFAVNIYTVNLYNSNHITVTQESVEETYNLIPTKSLYE